MYLKRTKLFIAALAMGAIPLGLSGTCNPFTGSLSVFRDVGHNDFFVEDIFFEDDFFLEDDCLFFDCGF